MRRNPKLSIDQWRAMTPEAHRQLLEMYMCDVVNIGTVIKSTAMIYGSDINKMIKCIGKIHGKYKAWQRGKQLADKLNLRHPQV